MKGINPFSYLDVPQMLERLGIQAKKVGEDKFTSTCPFHNNKSHSWFIRNLPGRPFHGAHKCLSCGIGGGPKSLAQHLLGIDEDKAREWLKDLSKPPPLPFKIEEEIIPIKLKGKFKLPPCFRFAPIEEWPEKHREYILARVEEWQISAWGLGYVTTCKCKNSRHRDRIAIPVRNSQGKPLAYTTRAIGNSKLKYVEPGKEEKASRTIFGEQYWGNKKYLVIVEGIFDALAIESILGERVAVAALRGSSPRPTEMVKLSKFDGIIIATDPDKAGTKAREALNSSLGRHACVANMELPVGADPSKLLETVEGRRNLTEMLRSNLKQVQDAVTHSTR